jgi:signal transduction histidine kinase
LILLEDFYKKANTREFINNKLNPEIIEFLTKDNDNLKSKQETTQEMKENIKTVENTICDLVKGLNSSKSKSNLLHSLSFQLDEPEEETKVVGNKKKTTSLFRNQLISNFKKKKDLSKVHFVLSRFKQEFTSFIQIFTIPFRERTETKIYQISLRIKKLPKEDKNNIFEYLIKDVTKEREAEALKNEIRCKSLFLAKIAHEFKNPIITINSVCQTLNSRISQLINMNNSYQSSDYDSEEEAKLNSIITRRKSSIVNHNSLQENINFIITTSNYLMSLIYDLNYFTRVELNPHKRYSSDNILDENNLSKDCEFDLIPSLEFCLKIFRERQKNDDNKKNVTILSEYDKRLPDRINSNEMKFKQILVNLLSNAYKFTIVGRITLSAKMIDRNHVRFEISDTGTGIPEDKLEKIWDPFSLNEKNQSMNTYGSGLGLYIVKDLCRQINSSICYCSSEGEGSKFWFDIRTSQGESVNNNLSTKTLLQKPLMSESLKNIYQCNYSNNYPYSSDRTDKEIRCKSFGMKKQVIFRRDFE